MNRLSEGNKRAVDKIQGGLTKKLVFGPKKQILGVFLGGKRSFGQKKHSSAERKNCGFSVIPARTKSVVRQGHFFDDPDDSPEFRWNRTKIKGSCPSNVGMAKNGQKQGWAPKNDP